MIVNGTNPDHLMQRYMVVEYHQSHRAAIGFDAKGAFVRHMPLHNLMDSYHWVHLDEKHVLIVGSFHPSHKKHLDERSDVSLLPSLHSTKAVGKSMKNIDHWKALKKHLNASDTHSMADLSELLEAIHSPVFSANI